MNDVERSSVVSERDAASFGGEVRLHSRYQPQIEADRYIEALNPDRGIDYFILIEPGLGYLISALRKHCSNSKVIVLHADNGFRETESPDIPTWFPDSGIGVQEFLETTIPEGASARIIEWRPSLRVFGDSCLDLVRESAEFIKRCEASRRTSAAFGRRWVRNFFRSLTLLRRMILYKAMDMPIVITGAGPGLEAALPQIRAAREGIFVLAASSSLPALAAAGITPDMIVSTDGGGWALTHLYAAFRTNPAMLAMTLCAAVPSQCSALPLLPMNDGSLWQSMALHSIGIPSVLIPQRGTVTASALELALIIGTGSIFLAGMDLAVKDIQSHARPNGFDHLFFGTASRLRPVYSQFFVRSGEMRAGGSYDVYAAWFKSKIASWPARIFSLGGNHAVFKDNLPAKLLNGGGGAVSQKTVQDHFRIMTINASPQELCGRAAETLISALGDSQYARSLSAELAPLLFPFGVDDIPPDKIAPARIAEELRGIARLHRGECG